jgi:peptide/nickel transport system substrate-binding protein
MPEAFATTLTRRAVLRSTLLGAAAGLVPAGLRAQGADRLAIGLTFLTPGLDAAEGSAGWALASHGVAENLFTVDRHGDVVPQLASAATRLDARRWQVALAEGRRFQDGTAVTAEAVAAGLNRQGERNPVARASAGRLVFTASGPTLLLVQTERPTPVLPSILAEWAFAVARPDAAGAVFTGPFRPTGFQPGARLLLEPNRYHPTPPRLPATLIRFQDGQALALAFRAGELDLAFNLPVESLAMLRGGSGSVKSFPVAYQYMAILNARRPALADLQVRRAIALAVERADLARAIRGGTPSASLWAATFPFGGRGAPVADRAAAAALLEQAGWRLGRDGVRTQEGRRLALTLWAYPQRPDLVSLQPVLRAQLAAIGIAVETRVTEQAQALARSGEFDLLLWAQHTAPAGDPAFFPGGFLASGGGSNFGGAADTALDALVAAFAEADTVAARHAVARRIDAQVAETVPVLPLLTPEWHVGLSPRLAGYEPWGSDYFIMRADLGLSS